MIRDRVDFNGEAITFTKKMPALNLQKDIYVQN